MKRILPISTLLLISGMTLFIVTCTKDEDHEAIKKEAMTRALANEISSDSLESYVAWMEGMGTRFALADNHREVALKIKNRFSDMGYPDARLDSFMIDRTYHNIRYQQWQYNVIATLEGSIYPDSVCIVGGHYDDNLNSGDPFLTIPGANDNASGVAAALELARVMKKNNFSPRNTIEFIAFGCEELGLYGSSAYSAQVNQSSKKIKMMLNNDMIAYAPAINPSNWVINIIDYDNSHDLRKEAEQMCSKFTALSYANDNTYNRNSDSYPFFENGYKALFFISGVIDPGYHSLNDVTGNCNFRFCSEVVRISCAVLVYTN